MRVLLVAAGLCVGASAWAYDTPDGYGVKNVFIGTAGTPDANGVITTVSAEDFESMESLSSAWGSGNLWTNNASGTLYLDNIAEVEKPATVGGEVNYTMDGDNKVYDKPTYVGGKAVVFHNKTNKTSNPYYGTYSFDAVSSGKFVFSGDMYFTTSAGPLHVKFVDSDGNNIIDFHWNNGSGTRAFNYEYTNNEGTATTGASSYNYCDYRNYKGYGIRDFVLDLETGDFEFTIDFINTRTATNIIRSQEKRTGKIQTGRNIAQMRVGTDAAGSSTVNYYTYLDNVKLYTIDQTYAYTINYTNGGSTIANDTGRSFEDATVDAAASVTVGGVAYTPTSGATTSLTITTTEASNVLNVPVEASVPYTINYVYNEETISSENGYAIVGNTVDASITTSLWNEGGTTKYYIADAATTTFPIAATGNTFTVDLRLANTSAIASVNAVCSGTTHKSFTATGVEGENVTIYYSIVVKSDVDNKFYSVTTTDYSKALTYGASVDVTYTLDESIVGFTEVEMGTNSEQSGGGNGAWNSKLAEATVNAGVYRADIMVVSKGGSGSNHRQEGVFVSDVNVVSLSGNTNGLRTLDFVVPSNSTNIYVRGLGTSNYTDNLDYVIIRKTADLPSTENIVVTDAGMATYVSDYNLDFSSATTKAYKVNVASKGVATLTEVSKVPAKTPVLLYCAGGNGTGEDIAITTDAVDAVTGNDLMAGTGVAVATTDGEYTNMILNNIDSKIGFYFANGQTVATNRAYLHIATTLAPDAVGGSRMVMVFGDEATGIESVKSEEIKVKSEVFNLKGQRVSQPTKGLYIVNGKKVIMK